MPRRKKTDQSPSRFPNGPPPGWGSLGQNTGSNAPQQQAAASSNSIPSGTPLPFVDKEKIVKSMQEIFSHLDPDVIYIVLSESDFKVENAMDPLLELSVAAEATECVPPPISGFERTAAALLSPCHFSEGRSDPGFSEPIQRTSPQSTENLLTEELDLLVDQELETLAAQQDASEKHRGSNYFDVEVSISSFPPPPFTQQALPELLQSSLEFGSQRELRKSLDNQPGASALRSQLGASGDESVVGKQPVVDFTHLITDKYPDKAQPVLDLGTSGRPSAFQVYKKQELLQASSEETQGGISKTNTLSQDQIGSISPWNLEAPVFSPRIHENQVSITNPRGQSPHSHWPGQHRQMPPWMNTGPVSQPPLKPKTAIPKSWTLPASPLAPCNRLRLEGKVLVLLRGPPGSGKSTLARALFDHNRGGVILSTDEYFLHNGQYHFDPTVLGEAHNWNHKRAKEAFEMGKNPIIIDNTNMQGWEMRPYVVQALRHGYKVLFREPDTWWKNKPRELQRRTSHDVPVETIRRMLNGYERFVTVQSIMGSQMPEWKHQLVLENKSSQPPSSQTPCPDLVEQHGLTEGRKKSCHQLFSSLPDVSSIGRSQEGKKLEDCSHKSTESLNVQLSDKLSDKPKLSDEDDFDLGELDSELDAQLAVNNSAGDVKIPDCIVESVINEEQCAEPPVAFSESIKQRIKIHRSNRRSGIEKMDPVDLVKDTNQLDSKAVGKESTVEKKADGFEMIQLEEEAVTSKPLHFVGDWPSESPQVQREIRKREGRTSIHEKGNENASEERNIKAASVHTVPNIDEFQKLLNLVQTGKVAEESKSCSSQSLSPSSEEQGKDKAGSNSEDSHSNKFNSEESDQDIKQVQTELPDCVLDWKAGDSCMAKQPRTDSLEGPGIETEVVEISQHLVDPKYTNLLNPCQADLSIMSKAFELCHEGANSRDTDVNTCTDGNWNVENNRGSRAGGHDGSVSEISHDPLCETDNCMAPEGSQERKTRLSRRSGKQCKLALTFTQSYSDSASTTFQCQNTSPQNLDDKQISSSTPSSTQAFSLDLKPKFDLFAESSSEQDQELLTHPLLDDTGCFTQTEPQDFALLWRLNRQFSTTDMDATARCHLSDVTVVCGDSSRFMPELSSAVSAAVAVHPSGHREVPYRVVHDKGTQVEEKEFGVTQDHVESLRILSRHFKLVSFDTLEDLYDKCQHDLEWTTNLLLDSGERFFKDEDSMEENDSAINTDYSASALSKDSQGAAETNLCQTVLEECHHEDQPTVITEGAQLSTCDGVNDSWKNTINTDVVSFGDSVCLLANLNESDTSTNQEKTAELDRIVPKTKLEVERCENDKVMAQSELEGGAWGGSLDNGVIIEEVRVETEDDIASMNEASRLLQAELDEMEREEKQRKQRNQAHLNIQSVEMKLPTELALQLTELFGPVGIDPGECSAEDYAVQMDLSLAKLLHQKWKETIQERQKQALLSFHLMQESTAQWDDSQVIKTEQQDRTSQVNFLTKMDGYTSLDSRPEPWHQLMDHGNVSRPHVSLRDIIQEELALQSTVEQTRKSRADLDRRDGATVLKENQLFSLFPNIDKHFLQDIFRDHNYSLTQTELFLRSLLIKEPVKTVVATEAPRSDSHRATSKDREKSQKAVEVAVPDYQDTDDPEYDDFRAEANLQRKRQLESFSKAAEAYKQGRKEVASFYAQQGRLHGQRMREANHRAAAQIFERVNSSLLPNNILDLHGLHVGEALQHLAQVLQDKTADAQQGLCRPQLSVITGRGNHSQGGVARIRPAVVDYLTNKNYRFTEPTTGLVLVSLK